MAAISLRVTAVCLLITLSSRQFYQYFNKLSHSVSGVTNAPADVAWYSMRKASTTGRALASNFEGPEHLEDMPNSSDWLRIGTECGTDKVIHHYYHHIYPVHVNNALWQAKLSGQKHPVILELGIYRGASVCMWRKLYPWTKLVAVDISLNLMSSRMDIYDSFVRIIQADLSQDSGLQKVVHSLKDSKPVIIIDDAAHIPAHQTLALKKLFEHIMPGGIYIIEDIETNYWRSDVVLSGHKIGNRTVINGVKEVMELPQAEFFKDKSKLTKAVNFMGGSKNAEQVAEVSSAYNSIFLRKKKEEEFNIPKREYRHAKFQ